MKTVYLDNAASTRLDERVLDAMKPYLFDVYAVATSEFGYSMGLEAKDGLENARAAVAGALGASPEEIIFTSGDTEASNLALKGVARALESKAGKTATGRRSRIVVSKIEDFPVLNSARALEKQGLEAIYVGVDGEGLVDMGQLAAALGDGPSLVSIQHANQEIGTVQDIDAIARLVKERGALFHTDATHTLRRVPLDVSKTPVDLVTISAHTLHGPKGIGALYVRKGTPLEKITDGGFQERNLRAGLENIPAAVGFAKAIELATPEETAGLARMRDRLLDRVLAEVPNTTLNGHRMRRLPQNANVTFHLVEGESIMLQLDMRGFEVSTGSACFSRSLEASHVIMAIGGDHERAHGSVRFTFGRYNSMEEVDAVVDAASDVVRELRSISPLRADSAGAKGESPKGGAPK